MQPTPIFHVRLGHGLGNRLFQYASIKGIAAKLGYSFNVLENTVDSEHYQQTYDWFLSRVASDVGAYSIGRSVVYNQPDAEHIGIETNVDYIRQNRFDSILMNGYFQSEANFAHIKNELRDVLCDESLAIRHTLDMFHPLASTCIALHIRLGDYMTKTGHLINLQKYYERCITIVRNTRDTTHFLIVCEDPQNISKVYPNLLSFIEQQNKYTIVSTSTHSSLDPVEYDLYLLARCAGVICSNSTFSWWGAWIGLNRNDHTKMNNKVFIPDKWHHNNSHYVGMDGAVIVECI